MANEPERIMRLAINRPPRLKIAQDRSSIGLTRARARAHACTHTHAQHETSQIKTHGYAVYEHIML